MTLRFAFFWFFYFCIAASIFCEYPVIRQLNNDDVLFLQLQSDIASYYKQTAAGNAVPPLLLYEYIPKKEDTLLLLSARLNLPYETLATLNNLSGFSSLPAKLLVPNRPGLFLNEKPSTDLEALMLSWRNIDVKTKISVVRSQTRFDLIFLSGERFHAVERAFFLGILFRFPLPKGAITSNFGIRDDPFTGKKDYHNGIDIAAPLGTEVYASREGTILETGMNMLLGKYIILRHENNYESVYGHLNQVLVKSGSFIRSGTLIGMVGSTGKSTGSHLHFEIRKNGYALDPITLLPRLKQ